MMTTCYPNSLHSFQSPGAWKVDVAASSRACVLGSYLLEGFSYVDKKDFSIVFSVLRMVYYGVTLRRMLMHSLYDLSRRNMGKIPLQANMWPAEKYPHTSASGWWRSLLLRFTFAFPVPRLCSHDQAYSSMRIVPVSVCWTLYLICHKDQPRNESFPC